MQRFIVSTLVIIGLVVAANSTMLRADDAVAQAISCLRDPDAKVAARAAYALGQMEPEAASTIPALIDALNDNRPQTEFFGPMMPVVSDAAADALVAIGPPAVEPVTNLLDHQDVDIQQKAVFILRRMKTQAATAEPVLRRLAESSDDEYVRDAARAAVPVVSKRPPEILVEYVQRFLGEEDEFARQWAIETLEQYGEVARPAVPQLVEALSDESFASKGFADVGWQEPLRIDVANTLGSIGPAATAALPKLREMMQSDEDACVRAAAAFAVARIDTSDVESVTFLMNAAADRIDGCPARAVKHLRSLPDRAQSAIGVVQKLAEESGPVIRSEALLTLATLAGPEAVTTLTLALDAEDSTVRSAAAEGLGSLGAAARPAVDGLIKVMLTPEDSWHDRPAMKALVLIGEPREKIVAAVRQAAHGSFVSRYKLHQVVVALQTLDAQEAAIIELKRLAGESDDEDTRHWATAELSALSDSKLKDTSTSPTEPSP